MGTSSVARHAEQEADCEACAQARSKIAQRGRDIGLDFGGEVAALRGEADWDAELAEVRDEVLQYPDYYTQPFHAYAQGNLCWEAALQVIMKLPCIE